MENEGPNPKPFKPDPPERWDVAKARLYQWHKNSGAMEVYYWLYPEDRPPTREPQPEPEPQRGRSR
jgi:hypothetical protein